MNSWIQWFPTLLIDASIKTTVVMLTAMIATAMFRRSSAALRHLLWQFAAVSALLVPMLSVALPGWGVLPAWVSVGTPPSVAPSSDRVKPLPGAAFPAANPIPIQSLPTDAESAANSPQLIDIPRPTEHPLTKRDATQSIARESSVWPTLVWLLGVIVCLAPVVAGTVGLWRLERRTMLISSGPWFEMMKALRRELGINKTVFLLSSPDRSIPMTWGIRSARLLLPSEAMEWTPERLRVVLLHELAHVKRHDYLNAWVMQCACALYWFHPLVWFALRRSQAERERACDDIVISAGECASDYAEHLLEIASGLESKALAAYSAIAMARSSRLEERLHAILDETRNRRRLTAIVIVAVLIVVGCGTMVLSSLRARQANQKTPPQTRISPTTKAAGYTTVEQARLSVARANQPTTQISIDLKVTNEEDKQPVSGATVDLQTHLDGKQTNSQAVTDANGELRIRLARASGYLRVGVVHPDYTPRAVQWPLDGSAMGSPDSYAMELSKGITIGGIVQNEAGQAVEGVSINANVPSYGFNPGQSYTTRQTTRSGAQGHWTIEHAPAELRGIRFEMIHPQYSLTELTKATPESAAQLQAQTSVLTIGTGIPLSGTVLDDSARPIAGCKMWIQGSGALSDAIITDADGAFSGVYGRGKKTLTLYAPGWAPLMMDLDLQTGQPPLKVALTKGLQLRARVVDGQGRPIPETIIGIDQWRGSPTRLDWSTTSDANGEFIWSDAPIEGVRFAALKEGFNRAQGNLKPGVEGQTLTLQLLQNISGTVVDAATGTPITLFRIYEGQSRSKESTMLWPDVPAQGVQDARGEFVHPFRGIGGYYHQLRIVADGYAAGITPVIAPDEAGKKYEVRLAATASIGGVVRLPDGAPAVGAEVYVVRSGHVVTFLNGRFSQEYTPVIGGPVEKQIATADGRFDFPADTDPLAFFVAIHDVGYSIIPVADTSKSADVTLKRWGRIEGTLYAGGKPAPVGSYVALLMQQKMPLDSLRFSNVIQTKENGRFVLDRAIDAMFTIGPGRDSPRTPWVNPSGPVQPIEVTSGQTATIDIGRNGVAVTGKLIAPKEVGQIKFDDTRVMLSLTPIGYQRARGPEIPGRSEMSNSERIKWMEQWYRTDAGREYLKQEMAVSYGAELKDDGAFLIAAVKPGKYRLNVDILSSQPTDAQAGRIGGMLKEFEIQIGQTDPIDLGDLNIPRSSK